MKTINLTEKELINTKGGFILMAIAFGIVGLYVGWRIGRKEPIIIKIG